MDIAALSIVSSQSQVQQAAGIAMLKKTMDVADEQSIALQQMMSSAPISDPNLGQNIDISI
jgi:hypothetical protein